MVSIQSIFVGATALLHTALAGSCSFREGDVIALKGDTGKYISRCNGCIGGAAYPDSVNFQGPINAATTYSYWSIVDVGNGKIALKGDTGRYLARCNGCSPGATAPDQAFVHETSYVGKTWAQWTCEEVSENKIALKADTGKYLARCNGCLSNGPADAAFIHAKSWVNKPWVQFEVEHIKHIPTSCSFKDGEVIALEADTGKYLARCRDCIAGAAYPDSVNFQGPINDGTPYSYWTVYNTGNGKIALKGDLGNYLARCNQCVSSAAYPDEAFVHVKDWKEGDFAQWTCVDANNGKIALQSDTGKYLARCNGCVSNGPSDVAMVHAKNWQDGDFTQFAVVKKAPSVFKKACSDKSM